MAEYIDRNAAILSIGKLYTRNEIAFNDEEGQAYNDGIQEASNALNDVSAADVAPVVHAHWKKHIMRSHPIEGWVTDTIFFSCSSCGANEAGPAPYCRLCGARMDEK